MPLDEDVDQSPHRNPCFHGDTLAGNAEPVSHGRKVEDCHFDGRSHGRGLTGIWLEVYRHSEHPVPPGEVEARSAEARDGVEGVFSEQITVNDADVDREVPGQSRL